MLLLLAIFVAVYGEISIQDQALFQSWVKTQNKVYQSPEETNYRLSVFAKNAEFVRNWDALARGFSVGLNVFADLTNEEFRAAFNGMNISKVPGPNTLKARVPASVDWRTKGVVTPIKNQGQCGSCWSFSTTGSVEGIHAISTGKLVSLSEQNLVDCSTPEGNMGCEGGLMDSAFQYIISNKGIDTEASYPYTATGPNACRFNRANVGATISSYKDVVSGSESALQVAVAQQPTSVAIDASHMSFQLYTGGIYNEPACSSSQLDHGVLAVGYGVDSASGSPYWLVKNSWGTSWGMRGYIWMSRNKNNQCGIATAASFPIV
jgi:cathepsin L